MPWVAFEPLSIKQRAELIERWEAEWIDGGDAHLGIFLEGSVAGGCGLHRREARDVLAIGYWLRPQYVGKGLATSAARALTSGAFSLPEIAAVEIFHDSANERSAGGARRLGFEFVAESSYKAGATAEAAVVCTWRMSRSRWEGTA